MGLIRKILKKTLNFVARIRFRNIREIPFSLGKLQRSCIIITVRPIEEFHKFSFSKKLKALIFGIHFTHDEISQIAFSYAKAEIFGDDPDLGSMLFSLNLAKFKDDLDFSGLTEDDQKKALALSGQSNISQKQYNGKTLIPPLNLYLEEHLGPISTMLVPMSSRVLVVSARYFVDINPFFSFSQIRLSGHPRANGIIAYLYELMLLQQKTALAILDCHALAFSTLTQKRDDPSIVLLKEEMELIAKSELVVTYVKAAIEKTIALIGEAHELPPIENKKRHAQRVKALEDGLPEIAKKQPYCQYLLDEIRSENLEELNNIRTGILHKKGTSALQPHSFTEYKHISESPIPQLMDFAITHHRKASVILLGALALLVDELMRRKKLTENLDKDLRELENLVKNMKVAYETFWPK